jgi:hypothetical protein
MSTASVTGSTHLGSDFLIVSSKNKLKAVHRAAFSFSDFGFFSDYSAEKSKIGFIMIVFVKLP